MIEIITTTTTPTIQKEASLQEIEKLFIKLKELPMTDKVKTIDKPTPKVDFGTYLCGKVSQFPDHTVTNVAQISVYKHGNHWDFILCNKNGQEIGSINNDGEFFVDKEVELSPFAEKTLSAKTITYLLNLNKAEIYTLELTLEEATEHASRLWTKLEIPEHHLKWSDIKKFYPSFADATLEKDALKKKLSEAVAVQIELRTLLKEVQKADVKKLS